MASTAVEKIKEKLDIADVVGAYVELHKAGTNFKARCPFHNERTPSFVVSPGRGSYYCFGCHAKGDIFTFVQEMEGVDFKGALKQLAAKAGVELEAANAERKEETDRLRSCMEHARVFFMGNLERERAAAEYLSNRGIKNETVKGWSLGWAPDEWRALYDHLRAKKYTDKEIHDAGLSKLREGSEKGGERYYDTFRGRVMFPIFDSSGRTVGFSGRTLSKDPGIPKYLNSPETVLFNKSEVLYGLHVAKTEIRKKDYSILVEGQMDLCHCHQAGYANTVASSGTALTKGHLERLKKLSNRIVLAYDSDDAGIAAAEKAALMALELGMEVKIAPMPAGMDPADVISKDPRAWAEALKSSKHVIDFELERLLRQPDKRAVATGLKAKVLPFLAKLPSSIDKSHYAAEVARRTGIREEAIWQDLENPASAPVREVAAPSAERAKKPKSVFSVERRVMGILYWKPDLGDYRKRVEDVAGEAKFAAMREGTASEALELAFETEAYYDSKDDVLAKEMEELLLSLERRALEDELLNIRERVRAGEVEGAALDDTLRRSAEIARLLQEVKRKFRDG